MGKGVYNQIEILKEEKKMKKWICFVLAILLLCGCSAQRPGDQTTPPTETNAPVTEAPTVPTYEKTENPVKYFSLSMGEDYENILRMDVFYNEDGSVHLEYVGAEKKVGEFDANIMHGITAAFAESGLTELNGQDVYGEGEANGSMYVEFEDSTMVAVGYSGEIPEAFIQGYEKMEAFFVALTEALPVYVPQPVVLGEVEEVLLNPALDILNHSGIEQLDAYTVSQIAKDEYFGYTAGLGSNEGIAGAVSCAPMMMTSAYSMVIVKLDDATKANAVCADFEDNLDWQKWVCVAPDKAMIAVKDDMVLCLMGTEQAFADTVTGILATGWTEVKTLERP